MRWILLAVSGFSLALWVIVGSTANIIGLPLPALGQFNHPTLGIWQNASSSNTSTIEGKLSIDHPLSKGSVFYDERNVPHIFTKTNEEAVFIQGYITAKDRLWQMDISTRSTGGTLSEILGKRTVEHDKDQIHAGYRAAAQMAVKTWKEHFPEDYKLLQIYCEGFNTYVDQLQPKDYPVEYKLLGCSPRHWTVYDAALTLKGMTQSMTDRNDDVANEKAIEALGIEQFKELYPKWYPKQTPIVPTGTSFNTTDATARKRSALPVIGAPNAQKMSEDHINSKSTDLTSVNELHLYNEYYPFNGSNNWAIAGSKSLTGKPILAGDPHLSLRLPSIWYELQIHTEAGNIRGVSLPGLPFIVIGFNESIAWSMTNGSEDVVDYYRMKWTDSSKTAYVIGDKTYPVIIKEDSLKIKGQETTIVKTRWTERGPIPVSDPSSPFFDLAKDAIYLYTQTDRPTSEIGVLSKLIAVKNYQEFKSALLGYSEPIMNFAYADKHGDIGIISNGFWPLRSEDSIRSNNMAGLSVSDGSLANPNWTAYIPFEHLPEQHNPKRGFVSSANQPPTDHNYPYLYYGEFESWRGRYINRKLAQAERMDYKDMQALQLDAHSILAEELLPLLLARINRRQLTRDGVKWFRSLAEWDYNYTYNSKAAAFFERWRKRAYDLTVDEIKKDFTSIPVWKWIALLRTQPNHKLFDILNTNSKETAAIITQRAFDEVLESIEESPIDNWGKERNSQLDHLLKLPGFGAGELTANGHSSAPNVLKNSHGASWRMVVELGQKPHAYGVFPGGASGNPASINYEDGVEAWSRGRYFDLTYWPTIEVAAQKSVRQLIFE